MFRFPGRYYLIYGAILAITLLHYMTGTSHEHHYFHGIYRRLYYLPLILAAFAGGVRGGLLAALVVCIVYLPHAFGLGSIHADPAPAVEKTLEMVLYVAVALVTGMLVSRGDKTRLRLQRSIEEKERMEQELIRSAKLAAVGRLSAGLAHEIRNPLASIKGSAEILGDDFPDDHPKKRLLKVLVEEADRLNRVLTRFLSFARPQAPEKRRVDLASEAEAVVSLLSGQQDGRSAKIEVQSRSAAGPFVEGDPEMLRQVLLNLLLNALQATDGRGTIQISFEESDKGSGEVTLHIEDNGPGFTPEALDHLFSPFFTTRESGTGLGLAVSHRIVEAHGGRIEVENREGGGARVTVVLRAAVS